MVQKIVTEDEWELLQRRLSALEQRIRHEDAYLEKRRYQRKVEARRAEPRYSLADARENVDAKACGQA